MIKIIGNPGILQKKYQHPMNSVNLTTASCNPRNNRLIISPQYQSWQKRPFKFSLTKMNLEVKENLESLKKYFINEFSKNYQYPMTHTTCIDIIDFSIKIPEKHIN